MFFGEIVYVVVTPLAILGVVVLAILALSGRSEPDPRGERAYVLYLSLVSFIALFTLLFAAVDLASTAAQALVDPDSGACVDPFSPECLGRPDDFGIDSGGELRTRDLLNSGAIAVVAGAILLFHQGKTRRLLDEDGFAGSAGARTLTAYLYAVSFTAMAILLVGAAIVVPAAIRAIAPGLTALESSDAERDAALLDLLPALVAAAGGVVVYLTHWRAAGRLRRGGHG
ncbi:MAG TPA: hypothetical protein VHN37_02390 [Actinomycetota bacterium]|nr:hypothetical protein [Actinomycetota bacterium]